MNYFQDIIEKLTAYWSSVGCASHFGYDLEMGAGTFNPATFFKSLGPEPYKVAYLEPSRRPADGRYGNNPNRMQHFLQYQVILKPAPINIQSLYLESLKAIGIDMNKHDIRFVHDDWKSPTLGAWGLGWEIWIDGMEVSQFTYFQNFGGIDLDVVPGEITYGLERLAMYLQNIDNVYELKWNKDLTYGDIFHQNEVQWSTYNFEESNPDLWHTHFNDFEKEALSLIEKNLPIPGYDFVMKASHAFNMLDARGVISVSERTNYINRVRNLACQIANLYLSHREKLSYPLLKEKKVKSKKLEFRPNAFDPDQKEDFVLEIGVEELPQTFIPIGIENLKKDLEAFLKKEELSYSSISTYGSPRRLVAYIHDLSFGKKGTILEKKGPPTSKAFDSQGNPTSLGKGFLDSLEKPSYSLKEIHEDVDSSLRIETLKGQPYLFVKKEINPISTSEIFFHKLGKLILDLDFPKKMIWDDPTISFARPIHTLVALHGKNVVPFSIGNIVSDRNTTGHPSLSHEKISIKEAAHYFEDLEKHFVIVDQNKRREEILKQIAKIEKKENFKAEHVETVMSEVLYLCESPHIILGSFDPKFLELPKELLQLVLITHQRHFPLVDEVGQATSNFLICLDTKPNATIKKGHEKAVSPRLEDGLFLYHQDLKLGLNHFSKKLNDITFYQKLGSLKDKSERILKHALLIQEHLDLSIREKDLQDACKFLKADLASHVVFEFPELQGVMGKAYAEAENLSPEVGKAIYEHWLPRYDEDNLPKSSLGTLLSLSDKIDNLLSCFLTDRIPSSSSDPYALRRQTLGIIRILIENKCHFPLKKVFQKALNHFNIQATKEVLDHLDQFIISRVKTVLTQYHLRPDEIQAILTLDHLDIYDLYLRAKSLHEFKEHELFTPLLEVYKRAKGQLHVEILKPTNPSFFETEEEKSLYQHFVEVEKSFHQCVEERLYSESFHLLATLQGPLSDLFDHVKILVQDERVRINRLSMLNQIVSLFKKLFDFDLVKE